MTIWVCWSQTCDTSMYVDTCVGGIVINTYTRILTKSDGSRQLNSRGGRCNSCTQDDQENESKIESGEIEENNYDVTKIQRLAMGTIKILKYDLLQTQQGKLPWCHIPSWMLFSAQKIAFWTRPPYERFWTRIPSKRQTTGIISSWIIMDHHDMTHVHEKFMTFTRVFFFCSAK